MLTSLQLNASAILVPDLPREEAEVIADACASHDLALVYILAPTSTEERITFLSEGATSFIYLVALKGVTGARDALSPELSEFIERVRAFTDKPLAVGFGIGTLEQACKVGGQADGVIVGSALVQTAGRSVEEAIALASALRAALAHY